MTTLPLVTPVWTSEDPLSLLAMIVSLTSSMGTKVDGGSSGVLTARPLRDLFSLLPDLSLLGPGN